MLVGDDGDCIPKILKNFQMDKAGLDRYLQGPFRSLWQVGKGGVQPAEGVTSNGQVQMWFAKRIKQRCTLSYTFSVDFILDLAIQQYAVCPSLGIFRSC